MDWSGCQGISGLLLLLYTVHSTIYTVHLTVYTVNPTRYTLQCTHLECLSCIVYIVENVFAPVSCYNWSLPAGS